MYLGIEYRGTALLAPYLNNARTHSPAQVEQIAGSIKEFGFNNPILIDDDSEIIAGHGRLMAAELLGLEEVPTIKLSHLTDAQRRAFILADNKLAMNAGWDADLLSIELSDLKSIGADLNGLGFTDDELVVILGDAGETGFPDMPDGDREPFQQMAFSLHDEQAEIVKDAILKAKTNPEYDTGINENSSGNALAYICEAFLERG